MRPWPTRDDDQDLLRVFDPRRNEDFEFGPLPDGSLVSSRARNLAVVHVTPLYELISSPNSKVRAGALSSFELDKGIGFVCAFAAPKQVEAALPPDTRGGGQGLLSYFPATAHDFRKEFELFEGMTYGELTIGCVSGDLLGSDLGANARKTASRTDDFELLFVIARSELVGWLVSLYADTGDALIVARGATHLDALLSKLRGKR